MSRRACFVLHRICDGLRSLPDYEFDALTELKDWFNVHMSSPFDHLPRDRRYETSNLLVQAKRARTS